MKGSTRNNGSATIKSDAIPDQEFYILRLYVAGQTKKSLAAFVRSTCPACTSLKSDIYQYPIYAKDGQIVAAPTLIKELPLP